MQGDIIKIYESNENGKQAGCVKASNGNLYSIYQLPSEIKVRDRVEFNTKVSQQSGKEYAVFVSKVDSYFDIYGEDAELEAIQQWIDTIDGLRDKVMEDGIKKEHRVGHDYVIYFKDGSKTIVEVKNEEDYWYSITGNITIDAISSFDVESEEIQEYIDNNRNWIEKEDYQRFLEGININRRGSLYDSDADIMVKRIIDGDFIQAYDMQQLKRDANQFETGYRLRINDKKSYGIEENWKSATYCIPPSDLEEYEINSYEEIPKRNS